MKYFEAVVAFGSTSLGEAVKTCRGCLGARGVLIRGVRAHHASGELQIGTDLCRRDPCRLLLIQKQQLQIVHSTFIALCTVARMAAAAATRIVVLFTFHDGAFDPARHGFTVGAGLCKMLPYA